MTPEQRYDISSDEYAFYRAQARYLFQAAGMGDPSTEIVEAYARQMKNCTMKPDHRTSLIYALNSIDSGLTIQFQEGFSYMIPFTIDEEIDGKREVVHTYTERAYPQDIFRNIDSPSTPSEFTRIVPEPGVNLVREVPTVNEPIPTQPIVQEKISIGFHKVILLR